MKTLSSYREDYERYTTKLSDVNRNMAFAGIAIVWIFKKSNGVDISISHELILPSILLIIGLSFDMLQYIYQSITWACFYRIKEKELKDESKKVNASPCLNIAAWIFFGLKIATVIFAHILILNYMFKTLI